MDWKSKDVGKLVGRSWVVRGWWMGMEGEGVVPVQNDTGLACTTYDLLGLQYSYPYLLRSVSIDIHRICCSKELADVRWSVERAKEIPDVPMFHSHLGVLLETLQLLPRARARAGFLPRFGWCSANMRPDRQPTFTTPPPLKPPRWAIPYTTAP